MATATESRPLDASARLGASRRGFGDLSAEIAAASERRAELWHQLSLRPSDSARRELEDLTGVIEALWQQARQARAEARHGARRAILERAAREARFEGELKRRQRRARR